MSTIELETRKPPSRWQRLPRAGRIAIIIIGAAIGVNLLARFVTASTGGGTPSGRTSSAYGTQTDGLAGYAALLRAEGHPIALQRGSLESTTLDPTATVVVLDPDTLSSNEAGVLLTFVVNGGRLITGGQAPAYFSALRDHPPHWDATAAEHWTTIAPSLSPIRRIVSSGDGGFDAPGSTTPLVGDRTDALVTEATVGLGTIDFVADASPLQNQLLGTADNAALGLALAGAAGRPVVFIEGVHGYGTASGLGAIPNDWKIALVGLALAGLVLIWARGRRLGPPEDSSRPLPPPRATYVDAVGSTLVRTHRPDDALRAVVQRIHAQIDARATIGADGAAGATTDLDAVEFARRAHAMGLSDEEIDAIRSPVTDDTVLAVGRALSRVVQSTGRERQ